MQSTLPVARLCSAAAHQNRVLLRSVTASAGIRRGAPGYHPAQSQGHIKAVAVARAVQNAIHNQSFRLGVMEVASLTIRTAAWRVSRGLHSCASNWALTTRSASSTSKDLNCVLQASQMPIMGTSCVTILRLRFGMNTDFPDQSSEASQVVTNVRRFCGVLGLSGPRRCALARDAPH